MTISVGDRLPDVPLAIATPDGPQPTTSGEFFGGKKVALFAVPGAFTPTCSVRHLPSFVDKAGELKAKGIDEIAAISVNDAFVMRAWAEDQAVGDDIVMLADGGADFTKAIGLDFDASKFGMGVRSQRYSMIVDDGVVKELNVESAGRIVADELCRNLAIRAGHLSTPRNWLLECGRSRAFQGTRVPQPEDYDSLAAGTDSDSAQLA